MLTDISRWCPAYATKHSDRLDSLVLLGTGGPTLEFMRPFGDTLAGRASPERVYATIQH